MKPVAQRHPTHLSEGVDMTLDSISTACLRYTYLAEQAIHQFTFKESSRQAIDDWIDIVTRIYAGLGEGDTVCFLLDLSESGTLPLTYAISRTRAFSDSLTFHPTLRAAFIHPSDGLRGLANTLFRVMRMGHLFTRFFEVGQAEAAMAWLKSTSR
jgi:hypothetical protein